MLSTKTLQTSPINAAANLPPHLEAWRELAGGAPMRSPEWLLTWWEIYASPDDELCVLLFHEEGGALVGLAPLYLQNISGTATFRLLGSENVNTNHTTWIAADGWEIPVGIEVARYLLDCKADWGRLLFESVDGDDPAINATMNFLKDHDCLVSRRPNPNCWKIALPASWDDYLRMLSRSLRKRCRRLQRQYFDSGMIQVRQVTDEEDLQKGFEILLKLHTCRWGNAKEPAGLFSDQRFRKFHETVSRRMLVRNNLRLAWLEHEEKPIAVEYQFVDSRAVYAYQSGIDLSMDKYSPGKLSMMAAIQFAIARGCKSFDLLSGDEPYKANWRAAPSPCHDIRAWQDGIGARAQWAVWELFALAVRRLKTKMPPRLIKGIRRIIPR